MEFYLLFTLAILANLPIGFIALKKKSLRVPDGVITAAITGMFVFLAHPVLWGLLLSFFVSSSYLSKYKEATNEKSTAMLYAEKGGQRDSLQVIANGGPALIGSLLVIYKMGLFENDYFSPLFLFIAISFASSTADTWATEIGTTSKSDPRWIFNLNKSVPKGTSGAVSLLGTTATALGAIFIAILYAIFVIIGTQEISIDIGLFIILISVGGFLGSLIDTMLGASYQSVYQCPKCDKKTEKRKHRHSESITTTHVTGFRWLNNDMVNFLSSFLSSLFITFIYWIYF
ncbi:MAG: hypothetical protein HeimC2_34050 [Candidatus Heimdallarchaeota archaeon LC_2]|nr:MAG: hypothetical protein HeimC2_34050 [Candidatus Heimdallarchaeota archaeon LC_2]